MRPLEHWRIDGLGDCVYALSLPTRPGSVRDSMFRAERFCAQLVAANLVHAGELALVVGAGPVGMSVTGELLKWGVKVVSCHTDPAANEATLMNCASRHICPATYDFPADHWPLPDYPLVDVIHKHVASEDRPVTFPDDGLAWSQGPAEQVISTIRGSLDDLKEELDHVPNVDFIVVEPGVLVALEPTRERWADGSTTDAAWATLKLATGENIRRLFRVVILCTGAGSHQTTLTTEGGVFAGFGWWSDDDEMLDRPAVAAGKSVGILGAGDAGIADFVRLLTGRQDPSECIDALKLPEPLLANIAAGNRAMWTAYNDGTTGDHALLLELQESTILAIDAAWKADVELVARVHGLLIPPAKRPAVQLALRCEHFGVSYAGNRIVAQLLARALTSVRHESNGGLAPFRINVASARIDGLDGHRCDGDAVRCSTARHRVSFSHAACEGSLPSPIIAGCRVGGASAQWKATVDDQAVPVSYDRVILRLPPTFAPMPLPDNVKKAIAAKAALLSASDAAVRDVLPFYVW